MYIKIHQCVCVFLFSICLCCSFFLDMSVFLPHKVPSEYFIPLGPDPTLLQRFLGLLFHSVVLVG